jgi:hypothetical protein
VRGGQNHEDGEQQSCAEVIGIKMGIKRAKTMKRDQERKKGFRVDRCLDLHGTVWRTWLEIPVREVSINCSDRSHPLCSVLGWSSVSTTSTMMKSMYMDLVDRCP